MGVKEYKGKVLNRQFELQSEPRVHLAVVSLPNWNLRPILGSSNEA